MLRRKGAPACPNPNNRRLRGHRVKKGLDELGELDALANLTATAAASVSSSRTTQSHRRHSVCDNTTTARRDERDSARRCTSNTTTRASRQPPSCASSLFASMQSSSDATGKAAGPHGEDALVALDGSVFGPDWREWRVVKETIFDPLASVACKARCLDIIRVWRARARKHRPLPPYVETTALLLYPVLLDEGRDEIHGSDTDLDECSSKKSTTTVHSSSSSRSSDGMTDKNDKQDNTDEDYNNRSSNRATESGAEAATHPSLHNRPSDCDRSTRRRSNRIDWGDTYTTLLDSDFLAQCYGAALSRAVHVMTGSFAEGEEGDTYRKRARALGFPEEAVEVRQRVAHAALTPTLSELRWVTSLVLQFLYRRFWLVQEAYARKMETPTGDAAGRRGSTPGQQQNKQLARRNNNGTNTYNNNNNDNTNSNTNSNSQSHERDGHRLCGASKAVMSIDEMRKFVSELSSTSEDESESRSTGSARAKTRNKKRRCDEGETRDAQDDGALKSSLAHRRDTNTKATRDDAATTRRKVDKSHENALLGWLVQ